MTSAPVSNLNGITLFSTPSVIVHEDSCLESTEPRKAVSKLSSLVDVAIVFEKHCTWK